MKKWNHLSYLATNDVIFDILKAWPPEWRAQAISATEMENSTTQQKKEETKLWMAQLAENRRKEVAAKAQKAVEKEHEGRKSPSPE